MTSSQVKSLDNEKRLSMKLVAEHFSSPSMNGRFPTVINPYNTLQTTPGPFQIVERTTKLGNRCWPVVSFLNINLQTVALKRDMEAIRYMFLREKAFL